MKKEDLLNALQNDYLLKNSANVTFVIVGGTPEPELIVNTPASYSAKAERIDTAYNDDLELVSFPKIKMIGAYFSDDRGCRIKELGEKAH